jgi:hypothetical protein
VPERFAASEGEGVKIVNKRLLKEMAKPGPCSWCGRPCPDGRDVHHWFIKRGMGGGTRLDIPENLISLDRFCHRDAEDRKICKDDLGAVRAAQLGRLQHDLERTILETLRRRKYDARTDALAAQEIPPLDSPKRGHNFGINILGSPRNEIE